MKTVVVVVAWLCLAVLFLVFISSLNIPKFSWLYHHGKVTNGTVTRLRPEMHNSFGVRFEVNGQTFESGGTGCEGRRVGEKTPVWYDPNHPELSMANDPGSALENEWTVAILVALFFPTAIVAAFCDWIRKRKPFPSQKSSQSLSKKFP
jgi:hypothetical protein